MSQALTANAHARPRQPNPWRGPRLLHAQGLAEPVMMVAAVIGIRIVLDLWFVAGDLGDGYKDLWRQSLAVWSSAFRWVPAGLALTAAASRLLGLGMTDAAVVAALSLVGIWVAPLAYGLAAAAPVDVVVVSCIAVALMGALAAAWCARASALKTSAYALLAAAIIAIDAAWPDLHAWLADSLGLAVRGALLPGLNPPQRASYGVAPLFLVALVALIGTGRRDPVFPHSAAARFFGWPAGAFAVLAVGWGFMVTAVDMGYGFGTLHPPVLYAPVLGLIALWLAATAAALIAQRHRRRAEAVGVTDCLALLVLAGLVAFPIGVGFLAAAGALALLALLVAWPLGAPRLPGWAVPLLGGLAGPALYGAGMAAVPGIADDQFLSRGVALGGMAAAGASVAVIGTRRGSNTSASRWSDQIWLADLMAALAIVFFASGVRDPMVWIGTALAWLALVIISVIPSTAREPGQRLLWHALPFACALFLLALLGLMLRQIYH